MNTKGEHAAGSSVDVRWSRSSPPRVCRVTRAPSRQQQPRRLDTPAPRTYGTVWAWGGNKYGQLGDGTTDERSVPGIGQGSRTATTNWATEPMSIASSRYESTNSKMCARSQPGFSTTLLSRTMAP
jgi:hypothetical protein